MAASTHDYKHTRYTSGSTEVGLTLTVAIRNFVIHLGPQFPHL